ncbi:MAG: hypothetical protein J07HB67_01815 [halophilic archaeon J07HB67]|nr:MAG: hypothetical protein J07HB67_01815 [halophilic archaeon J07HB67]
MRTHDLVARFASNPTAVAAVATVAVVVVAATVALVGDAALVGDTAHTLGGTENGTLFEPTDGIGSGGPTNVGGGD